MTLRQRLCVSTNSDSILPGARIMLIRQKNGMSQTDLANEFDKDRQSINRLEKSNVNPSVLFLHRFPQALKVLLGDLVDM